MLEEIKQKLQNLNSRLQPIVAKKDLESVKLQISELEQKTQAPDFWSDAEEAQRVMSKIGGLKNEIEKLEDTIKKVNSALDLVNEVNEDDLEFIDVLKNDAQELDTLISELELETFLSGKFDKNNAYLHIFAGQGGTEAMDWSDILKRMYLRYINSKGWKVSVIEEVRGTEAGIQSVVLEVIGTNAYGLLKHEHGTHRLVRNSPFNAQGLRQTSFSGVEVTPMVEEDVDIEVKEEDLDFQAVRSSGAGGQNVNKVATKVRLHHIPSGITIESSAQRTQSQNRETAMRMLKAKLYEIEEQKQKDALSAEKGEHKKASWGNQIRNYVLQPYKLVKDLRTDVETNQADRVLDGDIQKFIDAEVRML